MNSIPTISLYHPVPAQPPAPIAPPPTIMAAPLSYEFRVVEWIKDGEIKKVGLQVKCNQHDQYGNIQVHGTWTDVPREQLNLME